MDEFVENLEGRCGKFWKSHSFDLKWFLFDLNKTRYWIETKSEESCLKNSTFKTHSMFCARIKNYCLLSQIMTVEFPATNEKTFYKISIIFYNTVSGNSRNYLKVFLFSRHFYCCWKVKEAVKCDLLCQFLHLNWQFCLGNFHWLYYEKFKYRSILFEFLQGY